MTTFNEFIDRGRNIGVNFILDVRLVRGITTVTRRYSQAFTRNAGTTPMAEARIVKMGNLTKAFGPNRGLTATTLSVTLDNSDGGCDWLSDRLTFVSDALVAEFVLIAEVYDPANPADFDTKVLGLFVLMDPPQRNESTIELQLVDDALGAASEIAVTPSVRDWVAITDANRPSWLGDTNVNGNFRGANPDFDWNAPLPLQFGTEVPCQWVGRNCYVICAVAGSAGALPTGINGFSFTDGFGGRTGLPQTLPRIGLGAGTTQTVWTVRRTPDIVKNGKTFHLLWVDLDLTDNTGGLPNSRLPSVFFRAGIGEANAAPGSSNAVELFTYWGIHALIQPVSALGYLFSHPANDVNTLTGVHSTQVALDLVQSYAAVTVAVDTASFAAARNALPAATAQGEVTPFADASLAYGGQLNKELASLASVGFFDLAFTWLGTLKAFPNVANFDTLAATIATLGSEDIVGEVTERIPGIGERNAPFNRLVATTLNGQVTVDDGGTIATWKRIITKKVDGSWIAPSGPGRLIFYGLIDTTVRPVLTVRTFINGLKFDLGDYLRFSWPRGNGVANVYTNAVFRIESLTLDPDSCTVQFDMVWVNDFFDGSVTPYVLDDETLSTRATGSGGRTATLTTGSTTISFSSGNLVSDGVVTGDQIIVLDPTEASDSFNRARVLNISTVAATTCVVDASDFGAGGPFVISAWEIRRSQQTYRSNATVYGKTSNASSQFGNPLVSANRLLAG